MSQYLGLDFSTQKLKAVVIDEGLKLVHESQVNFDAQLPEFRTQGGVIKGSNGSVTTPVLLWVKALDLLFDQMQLEGVNFSDIRAICGAAQQHGSVYWQKDSKKILNALDPSQFLHQQLQGCFSVKDSPTWMDSSTTKYCKRLEEALGGPEKLSEITGSRAHERFTGPQIAKLAENRETAYENCERISLISNFACSLFIGEYADMDFPDASGTNLMNIRTKEWDEDCLQALKAPNVKEKLGKPVPPHTNLGFISDYFVKRFGFNPSCSVGSFTGDNPSSFAVFSSWRISEWPRMKLSMDLYAAYCLHQGSWTDSFSQCTREHIHQLLPFADGQYSQGRFGVHFAERQISYIPKGEHECKLGMRLSENDIIISLGTSDTVILPIKEPSIFPEGHLMCSATSENGFLGLLCFKNGSLTRERIRNVYSNKSWEEFESLLNSTPRGNFGNFGLYFDHQEILPFAKPGDYRWNSEGKPVNRFSTNEIEIRALIEGQCLARRAYAEDMCLFRNDKNRIIATGGASCNVSILQVLADVFNIPVYTQTCSNSAALGAAYLSKMAVEPNTKFEQLIQQLPEPTLICKPNKDAAQIYEPMLKRYKILIENIN